MINQWSYSRLSCFEKCPKQAEFKFVKKLKEPGSPAMDRGKHIHKLFLISTDDNLSSSPFKCAEAALIKIRRNIKILHALLTLDVLFIDEMGQISALLICTIDIILRKLCNSDLPFGGVYISGTMNNCQIQPINQIPFLTSTLVLTCFFHNEGLLQV